MRCVKRCSLCYGTLAVRVPVVAIIPLALISLCELIRMGCISTDAIVALCSMTGIRRGLSRPVGGRRHSHSPLRGSHLTSCFLPPTCTSCTRPRATDNTLPSKSIQRTGTQFEFLFPGGEFVDAGALRDGVSEVVRCRERSSSGLRDCPRLNVAPLSSVQQLQAYDLSVLPALLTSHHCDSLCVAGSAVSISRVDSAE